ncbi:hypothetical protein IV102_12050 [bacterium]|nr:hypothetical protein [bacterium]
MKIQSVCTPNLSKLTPVGPQKSGQPVSDSFSKDCTPSWQPLHRQQMAKAVEVANSDVAGAAPGCLAGYGLQGGLWPAGGSGGRHGSGSRV